MPKRRTLAGRYRLSRCLAQGGMGFVYAAVDLSLQRDVAAKLIRGDAVHCPRVIERVRNEARFLAGFSHPNIVTVHDFGFHRGLPFLIMELLEGITLRQELRRHGRLPVGRVRHVLSGICAAVEVAHHRHLVHRDLKPENVMLTGADYSVPKILDFGIARLLPIDRTSSDMRGPDERVGTLPYMAPEQLRGEAAKPAFDLWALGVLTFEMLTGRLPFTARFDSTSVWSASPFEGLPDGWQRFFSRALALDPARRPKHASELLARFDRARGGK